MANINTRSTMMSGEYWEIRWIGGIWRAVKAATTDGIKKRSIKVQNKAIHSASDGWIRRPKWKYDFSRRFLYEIWHTGSSIIRAGKYTELTIVTRYLVSFMLKNIQVIQSWIYFVRRHHLFATKSVLISLVSCFIKDKANKIWLYKEKN